LNSSEFRARRAATTYGQQTGSATDQLFRQINRTAEGKPSGGGGVLGFLNNIPGVGAGFRDLNEILQYGPVKRVLDVVDMPRSLAVSGVEKGLERLGGAKSDESFWNQAKRHIGYGQVINAEAPGLPQWAKIGIGFAGDIALDPLSYVGAGVVDQGTKEGAKLALSSSRKQLAIQLSERAAESGVNADRLIAEAGVKGRAALTTRNLAKLGIDDATKEALGIPKFGLTVGVGHNYRVGLGGRRLAEAVAEGKGALLHGAGSLPGADLVRQLRNPADEMKLNQVLLGGKGSFEQRATAAKILAVSSFRRGSGGLLEDQMHRWIMNEKLLKGLAHDDTEGILHAVERGVTDGKAGAVHGFYDALNSAAKQAGLDVQYRAGYIPHRLTPEAKAFLEDPQAFKKVGQSAKKFLNERFEQSRVLGKGDTFFGQTLKDGTIEEVNRVGRQAGLDFNWFETDLPTLMEKSIGEAGRAAERHAIVTQLERYGLAERAPQIAEDVVKMTSAEKARVKNLKNLEEGATRLQGAAEARAAKARSRIVSTMQDALKKTKRGVEVSLTDLQNRIDESLAKTEQLGIKRDIAQQAHDTAAQALDVAKKQAQNARRSERRSALAKVAELQKTVEARRVDLEALHNTYRQATADAAAADELLKQTRELRQTQMAQAAERSGRRLRLGGTVQGQALERSLTPEKAALAEAQQSAEAVGGQVAEEEAARAALEQARQAVPSGPITSPAVETSKAQVETLRNQLSKMDQVAKDTALERASGEDLSRQLLAREAEIDKVIGKPVSKRNIALNRQRAELVELSDRSKLLREVMDNPARPSVERRIAELEARATAAEMDAAKWMDTAALRADTLKGLQDEATRRVVRYKIAKGMSELAPGWQAQPDVAKAVQNLISVFDEPTAAKRALREWDKIVQWTKTWMVSTPGFVSRNLYGGMFNNLISGVSFDDYREFMRDFRVYQKDPINYADKLAAQGRDVGRFQAALDSIAATGWGQSAQEATRTVFKGETKTVPVFGSQNSYSRWVRGKNEQVEDLLRGSHAYSVLRKGGSTQDAIDSVARWHFNYRDISEFDKGVKRVIPFWVFTSRNIPLQLQVLASKPHLVNRYLGNMQRELEQASSGPEGVTPSYFQELGAIHLPFQVPGLDNQGAQDYLLPDLPIIRLNEDLQRVEDPTQFLSDVIPELRVPLELRAGKQYFSDLPINPNYEAAPAYAQAPGLKQLLEAVGAVKQGASGPEMTGRTNYAIEQLLPFLSRAGRVNPAGQKGEEGLLSALTGVSLRANTKSRQTGEVLRRRRELENFINQMKSLQKGK